MRHVVLLLALVPLVLAGCTRPPPVEERPLNVTPSPEASPPTPTPSTAPPPTGTPPTSAPAPIPATPPAVPPSTAHTTTLAGTWHADAAASAPTPEGTAPSTTPNTNMSSTSEVYGERVPKLSVVEAGPAKAKLVATWTASTATATTIRVELVRDGKTLLSGKGASPLAMDVPPAAIALGDYGVVARPDAPGAFNAQDVAFVLTLEYR